MNKKRSEIVEKVRELYEKYGIRSVTMDDVVHEMGISKKTLYEYFSDKTELVAAVMESLYQQRKHFMSEALGDKVNAVEEMLSYYIVQTKMIKDHKPTLNYDLKKYYPDIYTQVTERKRKHIYESVFRNLQQGKEQGLYRDDLNEEIIARLNLMRVEAIMSSGIFKQEEIVAPDFFKEIFTYHMYGIVSDKGRIILEQNLDKLK